jgi:hypothetical protein
MPRLRTTLALVLGVGLLLLGGSAPAHAQAPAKTFKERTVEVLHPAVTPTAVVGSALGTVRTWFTPMTVNGASAPGHYMTGTVTTVAVEPSDGSEWRTSNLVFVFGSEPDQLVVGGVSTYPSTSATIAVGSQTVRPIIGGSGRYNGARGQVVSTNLGADGWTHVFRVLR